MSPARPSHPMRSSTPSSSAPNLPEAAPAWAGLAGLALAGLGLLSQSPAAGGPAAGWPAQTTPPQTTTFVQPPAFGDSDANRDLIAVTGPDQTGSGVLYVIDTKRRQLACYQASGGSGTQAGIRFLGARRIDLDLQVEGYNDHSKHSFRELEELFADLPAGEAEPPR